MTPTCGQLALFFAVTALGLAWIPSLILHEPAVEQHVIAGRTTEITADFRRPLALFRWAALGTAVAALAAGAAGLLRERSAVLPLASMALAALAIGFYHIAWGVSILTALFLIALVLRLRDPR